MSSVIIEELPDEGFEEGTASKYAAPFLMLKEKIAGAIPPKVKNEDGRRLRDVMAERLQKEFDEPRTEALRLALGTDVDHEIFRQMLFFPTVAHMRRYAQLITPDPDDDPHALKKQLFVPFLSLLYLHHKAELHLIVPFIEEGGLAALVNLLIHDNIHVRSQAIDVLTALTANDDLKWFDPVTPERANLHKQMLSLAMFGDFENTFVTRYMRKPFVECILANKQSKIPGGSLYCLQILAFWLSWARLRHTGQIPLCLSEELLAILKEWSLRPTEDGTTAEEKDLAKQLSEDFGRFMTAEALNRVIATNSGSDGILHLAANPQMSSAKWISVVSLTYNAGGDRTSLRFTNADMAKKQPQQQPTPSTAAQPAGAGAGAGAASAPAAATAAAPAVTASTAPAPPSTTTATAAKPAADKPAAAKPAAKPKKAAKAAPVVPDDPVLGPKAEGNSFYSRGKLRDAIMCYSRAIRAATDTPKATAKYADVAPALYANRAAAYLRRAQAKSASKTDKAADLKSCMSDCDCALDLDSKYVKVLLRRAKALRLLGRSHESEADAVVAKELAEASSDDAMVKEAEGIVEQLQKDRVKKKKAAPVRSEREMEMMRRIMQRGEIVMPQEWMNQVIKEPVVDPEDMPADPASLDGGTSSLPVSKVAVELPPEEDEEAGGAAADGTGAGVGAGVGAGAAGDVAPKKKNAKKAASATRSKAAREGAGAAKKAPKGGNKSSVNGSKLNAALRASRGGKDLTKLQTLLQKVEPATVAQVFGASATDDLVKFTVISLAQLADSKPSFAAQMLQGLPSVARFGTLVKFFSSKDKAVLKSSIDSIVAAASSDEDKAALEGIHGKFNL